jgi:hypothetical protein
LGNRSFDLGDWTRFGLLFWCSIAMPQHAFVIFGGGSVKLLLWRIWEPHPYGLLVPYALWALFFSALILSSDNCSHFPWEIAVLKYSPPWVHTNEVNS